MPGQDVGFFDVGSECPDLVIEGGDLKADNGLETPALISLFSDRRVSLEELPRGELDRMGWWADLISEVEGDLIGSRYWVLERNGKVSNPTVVELESILRQTFEWMIDDGIASRVVVSGERFGVDQIRGTVQIFRPNGDDIPFKFIWDGQQLKLFNKEAA